MQRFCISTTGAENEMCSNFAFLQHSTVSLDWRWLFLSTHRAAVGPWRNRQRSLCQFNELHSSESMGGYIETILFSLNTLNTQKYSLRFIHSLRWVQTFAMKWQNITNATSFGRLSLSHEKETPISWKESVTLKGIVDGGPPVLKTSALKLLWIIDTSENHPCFLCCHLFQTRIGNCIMWHQPHVIKSARRGLSTQNSTLRHKFFFFFFINVHFRNFDTRPHTTWSCKEGS